MIEACKLIREQFSFLKDRPFYFYIDDYSAPKITGELQANLNRLLMHRSSDIYFKLSTESPVSFVREDVDGKKFVESREYDLLNLGLKYLTDESNQRHEFLKDLFIDAFVKWRVIRFKRLKSFWDQYPAMKMLPPALSETKRKHITTQVVKLSSPCVAETFTISSDLWAVWWKITEARIN